VNGAGGINALRRFPFQCYILTQRGGPQPSTDGCCLPCRADPQLGSAVPRLFLNRGDRGIAACHLIQRPLPIACHCRMTSGAHTTPPHAARPSPHSPVSS
jgi:hypothetical protein